MKTSFLGVGLTRACRLHQCGGAVRPIVFILLLALLLPAFFIVLRQMRTPPAVPTPAGTDAAATIPAAPDQGLSRATLNVLRQLSTPVEVRFYALLTDGPSTTATRAFAGQASELLQKFEQAAQGRLRVIRIESRSPATETAARRDGIAPLSHTTKGTNFLGINLSCGNQKAVISSLSLEWGQALEFDLSRAIQQISHGLDGGRVLINPAPESFAARDEVRQAFPELDSMTLEEARRQVQEAGLQEYKQAVAEFQTQLQKAQEKLAQAQKTGPAETEAARQELQNLQARQVDQLRTISRRMQERLTAVDQIKSGLL